MISMLCCIPNAADSTSFYRGCGPLAELRKKMELNLLFASPVNWATMSMCDFVFMQRPFRPEDVQIAQIAKDANRPVWIDYDDFLLGVPQDNPVHSMYMNQTVQTSIIQLIGLADVITVSTLRIKELYTAIWERIHPGQQLKAKVYVLPNAFNDDVFKLREPRKDKIQKLITWRGGNTHQADLAEYCAPILDAMECDQSWTWNFIGYNPWFITRSAPKERCVVTEAIDILQYNKLMTMLRPLIHIVPLHDSDFNHCKSNIAWIESVAAGAVVLAPDWPEWRLPGTVTYKDQDTFLQGMKYLMQGGKIPELQKMAWDYLSSKMLLSKVNHLRERIAKKLAGKHVDWPEGGERSEARLDMPEEGTGLG